MAYFSMQTSAWILTIISIDRYLIITNYYWKQKFSRNIKFSIIIIVTVILIIALINFPTVFLNGKVNNYINIKSFSNSTPAPHSKKTANVLLSRDITIRKKVECYTSDYIIFWQKFSLLLECLFPLILMIVFNLLLINRTYKSSINLQKKSKEAAAHLPKVSSVASNHSPANSTHLKASTSCYDLAYLDQSSSAKAENPTAAPLGRPKSKLNCLSSFRIPCLTQKNDLTNSPPDPNPSGKRKKKLTLAGSKRKKRLDSYIEEETTLNDYSTTVNHKLNELSSAAASAHDCNESLANLEFLKYSYSVNKFSLLYKEPTSGSFALAATSFNQLNNSLSNTLNETEAKYSSGDTNRQRRHAARHTTARSSDRKINSLRNRRIVLMLSLLTLSFTLSTLPSSVFYTFLRPIINDKPYKRLLTMSFNLLRHLSHAFNFIIYFTSSSVIKQQLKETVREFKKKKVSASCCLKLSKYWCCCFLCFIPIGLKHLTNRFQASSSSSTRNKRRKKTSKAQSEPQLEASFVNNQDFVSQNKINGMYLDESYIFSQKSMRRNSLISVHSNLFGNSNSNNNNNASKAEDQVRAELIPNNSVSCVDVGENSKEAAAAAVALGDLSNLDNSSKLKVNSFRKKKFYL
jgi:multisubunit Na+/H+ antiporter MnhB subunit